MATRRSLVRLAINAGFDFALAALAVPLAQFLANPEGEFTLPLWAIPVGGLCLLAAGIPFRLSAQYWRFAGVSDLLGVAASSIATAAIFPMLLHAAGVIPPSLAFPAIYGLLLVVLLSLPRVAYRLMRETPGPEHAAAQTVLLVGAGDGADLFIRALAGERDPMLRVTGLLSLGHAQTGRRIHGQPILGAIADAPALLQRLRDDGRLPSALVVTEPDLTGAPLARLMQAADREGLRVLRAPRPTALDPTSPSGASLAGAGGIELKPVAIEDLLNRPQVALDRAGMARLLQGRRVLITGAGGSIGAELSRQVAALGPAELVLLDNGEFALWQIDLELGETAPAVPRRAIIADTRDEPRIRRVMEEIRPELVFHAAALKHVPIGEANPLEVLLTNAAGTRHVADTARAAGALAMVLISTDKAVNPSSIMGASKRVAEMYCQALDIAARAEKQLGREGGGREAGGREGGMRCITVRFGNVLGSTGSVVPLFQRQLARGGPLTVTHPDMERYFMTVREAVGLVLEASVVGADSASPDYLRDGGIFVLDMGEPVKIVDLARQMIRLAGRRPDSDVEIRFTGLRPGEKLFEELFHGMEPTVPTGHPGLLMATPRTADPAIIGRAIDEIAGACRAGHTRLALSLLGRLLPEFAHAAGQPAADANRA